jgi:hypothetical protein
MTAFLALSGDFRDDRNPSAFGEPSGHACWENFLQPAATNVEVPARAATTSFGIFGRAPLPSSKVRGGTDGWEAFAARVRQLHIDGFEEKVAKRGFDPYVATWAVRPDLAQKAAARKQYVGPRYFGQTNLVAIVPAVIKAKKK